MHRSRSKLALVTSIVIVSLAGSAVAQTTTRASVDSSGIQGDGSSRWPAISGDGRYVAFESDATNLVPGDTNAVTDVFLHDTVTGSTVRASVDSAGGQLTGFSYRPAISGNGRYVTFTYSVPNGLPEVYRFDAQSGQSTLVSVPNNGGAANGISTDSAISADGRYVAFNSNASNLVAGDTNGFADCFLRDMQTGTTILMSVDSSGVQGNGPSDFTPIAISADGTCVAFVSNASNLVPGDTNGYMDVFLHNRQTGTTSLVSVGNPYGFTIGTPSVSGDGRYVVFPTDAPLDPADTNGTMDIYEWDGQSGTVQRVSLDQAGQQVTASSSQAAISADGGMLAFQSDGTTFVAGDTNGAPDIFVRDLHSGRIVRASVNSSGVQGNATSQAPTISTDGRFVGFESSASNLVSGDTNAVDDAFLIDLTCTGAISTYCSPKTNSLGCVPSIGSLGLPSQSGPDNFYVTASNVRNNKLGMMLWSLASDSHPFFGGTLCVHTPIKRTPSQSSGGSASGNDCTGTYSYHFTQAYMLQQLLGADTTVFAQFWSRDPGFAPPNNVGLTNGLQFTICP